MKKSKNMIKNVLCFLLIAALAFSLGIPALATQPLESSRGGYVVDALVVPASNDGVVAAADLHTRRGSPVLDEDILGGGRSPLRQGTPVLDEGSSDYANYTVIRQGTPVLDEGSSSDTNYMVMRQGEPVLDAATSYTPAIPPPGYETVGTIYETDNILNATVVTIVYRGNGHTSGTVPGSHSVNTPGSAVLRQPGTMARTGHTFGGWRSSSSGNIFQAGQSVSFNGHGTIHYDAVWVPVNNTVTITYRGNGHTSGTVPANQTLTTPGNIQLRPQGNLARTGHTFVGWRDSAGNVWAAGSVIGWTNPTSGTLTLDAHWVPVSNTVTITYRGNGHTSGTVPANQTLTTPGTIQLRPQGNLARTGHTFVGWRDGAGNVWAAGSVIGWTNPTSGTLTLDAHWVPVSNTVTITYRGNGHTSGTVPANQTLTTPGNIQLRPQGNLVRTGHTFVGWRDGGGNVFAAESVIGWTNPTSGTLTLDAHWIPNSSNIVTIVYRGNGHTSGTPPANQSVTTPGDFVLRPQGNLARTGHTFGGWMLSDGRVFPEGTTLTFTVVNSGTMNIDAHWVPVQTSTLQFPLPSSVTGTIGLRFADPRRPGHQGIDLVAPRGTAVHAIERGRVIASGLVTTLRCDCCDSSVRSDWRIAIYHNNTRDPFDGTGRNLTSRYIHAGPEPHITNRATPLVPPDVLSGQPVARNERIASIGHHAHYAHLHIDINTHGLANVPTVAQSIDPERIWPTEIAQFASGSTGNAFTEVDCHVDDFDLAVAEGRYFDMRIINIVGLRELVAWLAVTPFSEANIVTLVHDFGITQAQLQQVVDQGNLQWAYNVSIIMSEVAMRSESVAANQTIQDVQSTQEGEAIKEEQIHLDEEVAQEE